MGSAASAANVSMVLRNCSLLMSHGAESPEGNAAHQPKVPLRFWPPQLQRSSRSDSGLAEPSIAKSFSRKKAASTGDNFEIQVCGSLLRVLDAVESIAGPVEVVEGSLAKPSFGMVPRD